MSEKRYAKAYVTEEICAKRVSEMKTDLATIKKALIGEDMRGGIVKDLADLILKFNANEESKETSLRWKLIVFSAVSALLGTVLGIIIDKI